MSGASDISRLFEMVGTSPAQYQEVEGREQSLGARGRWSMPSDTLSDDHFVWPEDEAQESALSVTDSEEPVFVSRAVVDSSSRSEPTLESAPHAPVVLSFAEPVVDMPPPPPLSSVFARLLKPDAPSGDAS